MTTKDKIFRTATRLFKEKGFNNVTVNDICDACEITKPTFYYHLRSKQDIILEYYDHVIENLTPVLIQMLDTSSHWEQILLLFDSLIDNFIDLGSDINSQLLIVNLQENKRTFDLRKDLEDIAVTIIQKAQEKNQIRNKNKAKQLYEAAAYMFTGYEYMWCVLKGDFSWKENYYRSLETLFDVEPSLRKYS
ncbi:MAG: TetR/AcrR family transcriptional regulator [Caldicoprobacterales bacterium]|jgi:AcrR family transcriptional regulator|nr:TetR/AcrR family transcriptional regulator [Clostridiales bacterium]